VPSSQKFIASNSRMKALLTVSSKKNRTEYKGIVKFHALVKKIEDEDGKVKAILYLKSNSIVCV
jgi:hypothetical protein